MQLHRCGLFATSGLALAAAVTACAIDVPDDGTEAAAVLTNPTIARRAVWDWWDRGGDLGTSWSTRGFDSFGWRSGAAPLGYGESYLTTTTSYGPDPANKIITTYFRHELTVNNPAAVTRILGEVMFDDGIVVYLNGVRIASDFMPAGATTSTTRALGHEANNAYKLYDWTAAKTSLITGVNAIGVEVHQAEPSSSDLVFDLSLQIDGDTATPPPTPTPIGGFGRGSLWSVRVASSGAQALGYHQAWFNADGWPTMPGPIGYGESYIRSTISYGPDPAHKYNTTYFRKDFRITDPEDVRHMVAEVMYDDGVAIYLNGFPVTALSLPPGFPSYNVPAYWHEASNTYETLDWDGFREYLRPGDNYIAAEVHQDDPGSSDLVFDMALALDLGPPSASIARRSGWSYWDQSGDLGTAWRTSSNNTGWGIGGGPLGFGENYVATHLDDDTPRITTYFRRQIHVTNPAAITMARIELMYDDGAVIYVNGSEIARFAMPAGTVTASTRSTGHEAENWYFDYNLTEAVRSRLVTGLNTIAVEVHQASTTSSDLVFDLALELATAATPRISGCEPATPTNSELRATWIAPGGEVWAVGTDGIVGRRATGGTWAWCRPVGATNLRFNSVWGSADNDVWMGGDDGVLLRWNGATFLTVNLGVAADLTEIWGSGAGNVFVVGHGGVIRHFDGTTWRTADIPGGHRFDGVWGANATDVWVIGWVPLPPAPQSVLDPCETEIYRWNATTFTFAREIAFENGHGSCGMNGISGASATDVWVMGKMAPAGSASGYDNFIVRFDGSTWRFMSLPSAYTERKSFTDLAINPPGLPGGVWITSWDDMAVRHDGTTWSEGPTPLTRRLGAIDTRGNTMFAVGSSAKVLRWNGAAWIQEH